MPKAKVAALKVRPETILKDTEKLCELAGMKQALDPSAVTILKDNISWHYPFPGANTTPWQLEGTTLALKNAGYREISAVQNKTVVTNAFKGEDLNHYVPIFKRYGVPVLYNFKDEDMKWIEYRPKARLHVLHKIFPEGIKIPDYFFGKNIVHLPTIKCVAGDTELVLGDGSLMAIRDLFARELARGSSPLVEADGTTHVPAMAVVMAMTADGAVKPCRVAIVSRSKADGRRVLQMTTRSGRKITTTADHLIRTPEAWLPLGELEPGARIAIARRLAVRGESQTLPQTHAARHATPVVPRAGRNYTAEFAHEIIESYQGGATTTSIAASAGVRWQRVQHILKRHDVELRRNVTRIDIPERTSPEFWRWVGYVMAEGCVERSGHCDKLWWTNSEPALRDDYMTLTAELFGVVPKTSRHNVYVYSRNLGAFLEELGLDVPLNAGNKRAPALLFRCPDEEVAAFLSSYLDGDGHVARKQASVISVTKSHGLARDLVTLYARLGVVAFVRPVTQKVGKNCELRTYYHVEVSGSAVRVLSKHLKLRHPGKSARLAAHAARLEVSKQPSNWDVAPLPPEWVRDIRLGVGLTQEATGMASSVNNVEHGHTRPTPRIARSLLASFRAADQRGEWRDEIDQLSAIANEDVAWDQVDCITEVTGSVDELFDLTVPDAGCFVGDGVILHNCHIYTTTTGAMKNAFGGLLSTKRHYTHTWIHRTLVDLLAIQKEIHTGLFAVMDGTTAGNGPGPRTMFPVIKDYMLASADQVAIDAVAAKMMGFDPMSLEYVKVAHDDGLGVGDPRDIEVVGADVSGESWGFEVGDNAASMVGDVMWFGAMKKFQKLFFHTPLVNVFVFGSEAYHDYYRWPRKDRLVFEGWKRDTAWGKLFDAYERGEAERVFRGSGAAAAPPGAE